MIAELPCLPVRSSPVDRQNVARYTVVCGAICVPIRSSDVDHGPAIALAIDSGIPETVVPLGIFMI